MSGTGHRPFAVVTGGSNGIGFELARQFLSNGYDVLIAGEEDGHLAEAARQLADGGGGTVTTLAADLSRPDGVDALHAAIGAAARPVDVLCVNAGIGLGGAFVETDLARELQMIDLNVRGAVQLTKLALPAMVARGSGKLLFTSSIAATMPDPFEAVYGATKAFLRWFGEALREELKDKGVGVTVLMPGVTGTNFFQRAEMMDTRGRRIEQQGRPGGRGPRRLRRPGGQQGQGPAAGQEQGARHRSRPAAGHPGGQGAPRHGRARLGSRGRQDLTAAEQGRGAAGAAPLPFSAAC